MESQALPQPDMAEFFDFNHASSPETNESEYRSLSASCTQPHPDGTSRVEPSPSRPEAFQEFSYTELIEALPATTDSSEQGTPSHAVPQQELPANWADDFSQWIPRYHKPQHACDYCHSRHLECFFTFEGQSSCSSCSALFRHCSFVASNQEPGKARNVIDTLHAVAEDTMIDRGKLTGVRLLKSSGPAENENDHLSGKSNGRLPRTAVAILKDWMMQHSHHPYPTEEEKQELQNLTGLKAGQISNWMANTRRRTKQRQKRAAFPGVSGASQAVNIPEGKTWDTLNPMDRWKISPPENEPAPLDAIASAVNQFAPPLEPDSLSGGPQHSSTSNSDNYSMFRAPSLTSLDTGFSAITSSGSNASLGSAWSFGSHNSFNSFGSFSSNARKERRRRRRVPPRPGRAESNGTRLFQCTFCTEKFKSKYDWSRHEKTLHISLEKWICAPLGPVITCPASGQSKCVYCDALDPTPEHLETHNHRCCEERGLEARTFYRKDHLRQHLRLMHNCKMTKTMEAWSSEASLIRSRCGFCQRNFNTWQERVDHLAKEFRSGASMKDWKGSRGLDASIEMQVTNAMPPYLIAQEAMTLNPFTGSKYASMEQAQGDLSADDEMMHTTEPGYFLDSCGEMPAPMPPMDEGQVNRLTTMSTTAPNPNCWELLTVRLGRLVRERMEQGLPVTDEILQREARMILYEHDDPWNQTAADNAEWLELFKKAHGLTESPADFQERDTLQHHVRFQGAALNQRWSTIPEMPCSKNGDALMMGRVKPEDRAGMPGVAVEWGPDVFSEGPTWDLSDEFDCFEPR